MAQRKKKIEKNVICSGRKEGEKETMKEEKKKRKKDDD